VPENLCDVRWDLSVFRVWVFRWIVRNAQPQYECRVGAGAPLVSTVNASYPEMRSYPQFLPLLDTNVKTDVQDVLSNLTRTHTHIHTHTRTHSVCLIWLPHTFFEMNVGYPSITTSHVLFQEFLPKTLHEFRWNLLLVVFTETYKASFILRR
jgi:hypothetical protein